MGLSEYLTMNEITEFSIDVVRFNTSDYKITQRGFTCRNNLREIHDKAYKLYLTVDDRLGYALYVASTRGGKLIYTNMPPHILDWYYQQVNLHKTN